MFSVRAPSPGLAYTNSGIYRVGLRNDVSRDDIISVQRTRTDRLLHRGRVLRASTRSSRWPGGEGEGYTSVCARVLRDASERAYIRPARAAPGLHRPRHDSAGSPFQGDGRKFRDSSCCSRCVLLLLLLLLLLCALLTGCRWWWWRTRVVAFRRHGGDSGPRVEDDRRTGRLRGRAGERKRDRRESRSSPTRLVSSRPIDTGSVLY